jgi:hypothetical protein
MSKSILESSCLINNYYRSLNRSLQTISARQQAFVRMAQFLLSIFDRTPNLNVSHHDISKETGFGISSLLFQQIFEVLAERFSNRGLPSPKVILEKGVFCLFISTVGEIEDDLIQSQLANISESQIILGRTHDITQTLVCESPPPFLELNWICYLLLAMTRCVS